MFLLGKATVSLQKEWQKLRLESHNIWMWSYWANAENIRTPCLQKFQNAPPPPIPAVMPLEFHYCYLPSLPFGISCFTPTPLQFYRIVVFKFMLWFLGAFSCGHLEKPKERGQFFRKRRKRSVLSLGGLGEGGGGAWFRQAVENDYDLKKKSSIVNKELVI